MKYLSYFLLLLLSSCSGRPRVENGEDAPYRTSGVEQFFLTELPHWANFSQPAQCFKSHSFQYLDFTKLREIHQLSYAQMLELQAQFNERRENYFRSTTYRFLKPIEEASFFSNTLEQVQGGVRLLRFPALVKEASVIWFESFPEQELKRVLKSSAFDEKLPILFSSCRSRGALAQWLLEENLDGLGVYLLSAEWLSPFKKDFAPAPGLSVDLSELLGKEIRINFLSFHNKTTPELSI
jgi:hypothetical protein